MADGIQIIIGGDASGLSGALTQATASMNAAAKSIDAASQKIVKSGAAANSAATNISAMDRSMAMATTRILAMDAGMGGLGMAMGRVAAASPILATAFSAAFPVFAVVAAVQVISALYDKVVSATSEVRKQGVEFLNATDSIVRHAESLKMDNLRLEDQINILEHRPATNKLKEALQEAKEKASQLAAELENDTNKMLDLVEKGGTVSLFQSIITGKGRTNEVSNAVKEQLRQLVDAQSEMRRAQDLGDKDREEAAKQNVEKWASAVLSALKDQQGRIQKEFHKMTTEGPAEGNLTGPWSSDEANGRLKEQKDMIDDLTISMNRLLGVEKDLKTNEQDRAKVGQLEQHKEAIKPLQDEANLEKLVAQGKEEQAKAEKAHADALAETKRIQDSTGGGKGSLTVAEVNANKDASIAAAVAERDAAITAADAVFTAQQKVHDKEVAAAEGNAAKIKEIDQQLANEKIKHEAEVQKARDEYDKKRVEAETKAASAIEDINVRAAERKDADNQRDAQKQIEGTRLSTEEQIKEVENAANLGLMTREEERARLQKIYAAELADVQTKIRTQIAAEEELRKYLGTQGQGPGSASYESSLSRERQLQDQLTNATKQYGVALQQVQSQTRQVALTTDQFLQKLITENKNASTQFRTEWQQNLQTLNAGFANAFNQWMAHNKSFGESMRDVGISILENWASMLIQMGLRWVETHIMMMLGAKATQTATAASQIASEAAVAGAGGTASMAAAPWPIDMGAPAFGAAMFANAMSYMSLAAAERGGIIDGDVGQAVPIIGHGKEMVLPAHLSSFVQDAASRASGRGGMGGAMPHFTFSPHINGDFNVEKHGHEMFKFMQRKLRGMGIRNV